MRDIPFGSYHKILDDKEFAKKRGKVSQVTGLIIRVEGLDAFVGEICEIEIKSSKRIVLSEVVGFVEQTVLLMPLDEVDEIGPGCLVQPTGKKFKVEVSDHMLGMTLDGLGRPYDKDKKVEGSFFDVNRNSPDPFQRNNIEQVLPTGVRAIDGLLTVGEGQRMGIFAGSGVGKSTLLGMIARYCQADVIVIGLIGERGREVKEFIEQDLGLEGYRKSVVVTATSDTPPLVRLKGAYVATAIAEYFRDLGFEVNLMMDSVTRVAMAQREVGLATGEPPTTKGYTPSVFSILPRLLERTGTNDKGSITAFYTVLVDGDDMNDPIADTVRGILDGHFILDRKLAEQGQFPAINVLKSISRVMNQIAEEEHLEVAQKIRTLMALYEENMELIQIGAYKHGTNAEIDEAIEYYPKIQQFLKQGIFEVVTFKETIQKLEALLYGGI